MDKNRLGSQCRPSCFSFSPPRDFDRGGIGSLQSPVSLALGSNPIQGSHAYRSNIIKKPVVLQPIWITKNETARRIKQRMSSVFKWSQAKQWRSNDPTDNIEKALPKYKKPVKHLESLPFDEVSQAIETVKNSHALPITKLAFEFLVLTATRSGDVRGMRWDELHGNKWVIPASRMKKGKEHRIPLSKRCMEIIAIAETMKDGSGLVFTNNGKPLSDMTLSKLMKELGIKAVPHGFRASFRGWTTEKTNYPWQVCEFALAHVVGDDAERAYQRLDLFEKRKHMMEAWAQYISNQKLM